MFLDLPKEILCHIFLFCNYDTISRLREVCKVFDVVAGSCLTEGFKKVQIEHAKCLKKVKDVIPRRESERRKHKLYSKHDALQGLDTRLSLLKMTYNKYIASGQCCFIPGKVLDEMFLVLCKLKVKAEFSSVTTLLQEVRDVSSMAMEHFDEVLVPNFDADHSMFQSLPFSFCNSSFSVNEEASRANSEPSVSATRTCSQCKVVQKQQKVLRQHVKLMSSKLKCCNNSLALQKMSLHSQNVKIRRMKMLIETLKKTVQDLSSQTSEMCSQMQVLRNALIPGTLPTHSVIENPQENHRLAVHANKRTSKRHIDLKDKHQNKMPAKRKR